MSKTHTYKEYVFSAPYPLNVINALMRDLDYSSNPLNSKTLTPSLKEKVIWMIDNLPAKERCLIHSCFRDKKSFEELSQIHDTSVQNIRAWYHRGFFFLFKQWDVVIDGHTHSFDISEKEDNAKYREHINALPCPRKTYNILIKASIITVGDIVSALKADPGYIINQRTFGRKGYEDLLRRLDRYLETEFYFRNTYSIENIRKLVKVKC